MQMKWRVRPFGACVGEPRTRADSRARFPDRTSGAIPGIDLIAGSRPVVREQRVRSCRRPIWLISLTRVTACKSANRTPTQFLRHRLAGGRPGMPPVATLGSGMAAPPTRRRRRGPAACGTWRRTAAFTAYLPWNPGHVPSPRRGPAVPRPSSPGHWRCRYGPSPAPAALCSHMRSSPRSRPCGPAKSDWARRKNALRPKSREWLPLVPLAKDFALDW